jgi:hypothetical protein
MPNSEVLVLSGSIPRVSSILNSINYLTAVKSSIHPTEVDVVGFIEE